ncbi:asparagine synthase (glutamine-hydrolyzing) [Candidatus Methylocalor cossyra]|uniref:asparagine synthase (glutamine-hydrolyzing) n=1 Tax=Candidatus Methylocalor cossyra TaxID=3108543 RepID=A0ABM9NIY1_9GAMM
MCGICGMVALEASEPPPREAVAAMVAHLARRGPDGAWIEGQGTALFGVTRLAIRALDAGRQPLVDPATGVMLACNGEIDNHRELRDWLAARGRSVEPDGDIAVLPGLYLELGDAFLERVRGVFALALWDPRRGKLLLARDRAGERPLFFARARGTVVFASQVAALAAGLPQVPAPDHAALCRYLQLGHFPAPDSPFAAMHKVGPGELVLLEPGGLTRVRYWRWRGTRQPKMGGDPTRTFDAVLQEAVARQSEVDVKVGVFLSGGVDSSLVAATARRLRPDQPLTAYGLRFREASYDEGPFAERVADYLGIDYVPVWVEPEAIPPLLSELIASCGEPLADPAWVPTALLARRASRDIRLALVGEGADELFGGYPTYSGAWLAGYYARLPAGVRALFRRLVERWPVSDKKVTLSFLLKRFVQGERLDPLSRHRLWTASIPPAVLERLGIAPHASPWQAPPGEGLLDRLQRYDLEGPLAEGLLTKADRAGMLFAVELRAPFLDQAVLEFAATLPAQERVRGLATKVFLKRYALRQLPRDIVHRRKRGLSVPLAVWLRGPLQDWAMAALSRPGLEEAFGLRRQAALQLLEEHRRRTADHARSLWALIVFSEWWAFAQRAAAEPRRWPDHPPASQRSSAASRSGVPMSIQKPS